MEDFTESVEEKQDEETEGEKEEQTAISEADEAIFSEGDVIAILEIEALGIRYPVIEGATADNLNQGIGHLTETAGIGETGNCVLAGHNGSRHGEFFTHLSELAEGDTVMILSADGTVFTYVVTDSYTVGPYENSIKDQGEEKELTLFTCAQKGTMRFVVRCLLYEETM
ncbi:class D sortase [Enterocloster bolteae]|uniref:class D sortase n=1 Tax=Enterocloster bolteae TaxID=208479 RepID=UPI00210AA3C0|nr:class D sortase [Enterocloster bolteae]